MDSAYFCYCAYTFCTSRDGPRMSGFLKGQLSSVTYFFVTLSAPKKHVFELMESLK